MGFGKQIGRIFGGDPLAAPAQDVYEGIVCQARQPAFYEACGVPDSIDGRFELVALHAFLVLRRLKRGGGRGADLAQALVDTLIQDLDRSLREMGVGDIGISRRIKTMARGFYGRIAAYEAGLDGSEDMLRAALMRNLYGTINEAPVSAVAAMAVYMRQAAARLDGQEMADMIAGTVAFGPPPEPDGGKRA
ncbi:MAG: ubiquinol-cytochrome C chaperone family protein [Alphaproteobacteria bacterium]